LIQPTTQEQPNEALPESAVRREPWVAVLYTWLIPGLGQWYAGATRNAAMYFLLVTGFGAAAAYFMFSAAGSPVAALACAAAGLGLFVRAVFDAFDKAAAANGVRGEAQRKLHKDPWLAVFLSLLFPGVGQMFNRRMAPGIVFLGLWLGAGMLERTIKSSLLTWYLLSVFTALIGFAACLHAWYSSPGLRPAQPPLRTLAFVVAALALLRGPTAVFAVNGFLAVAHQCRTGAMRPTIEEDDRVLCVPARNRAPRRGDLVVFLPPPAAFPEPQSGPVPPAFKRVIAVGGDSVAVRGNRIIVNGTAVTRNSGAALDLSAIRNIGAPRARTAHTLAPDEIFVAGDDLANSFDSREYGPVPVRNLRAYPYKIYWPPAHAGPIQ